MSGPAAWWRVTLVSTLALAGLVAALPRGSARPVLRVSAAASLRGVLEAAALDYEARTGAAVELSFGGSEQLMAGLAANSGDAVVPADRGYLERATAELGPPVDLATMRAVVLSRRPVKSLTELTTGHDRASLADPATAAIGRAVAQVLSRRGEWAAFRPCVASSPERVTDSLVALRANAVTAAVVWDVVARPHPEFVMSDVPELAGATATVAGAVRAGASGETGAARFLADLAGPAGQAHFRRAGFGPP